MTRFLNYTALVIISLSIFATHTHAAPLVSEHERWNGLQQMHKVTLRTSLSYEPIYRMDDDANYTGSSGIFWDNKLTVNFNADVSPYIGITIGAGDAFYFFGNIGVEKAFNYNIGVSIVPSLGIHAGIGGITSEFHLAGVHALVELTSSRWRFSPYLVAGIRYTHIFDVDTDLRDGLSLPLGVGLSLRI